MKTIKLIPLFIVVLIIASCVRPYPIYDLTPSGDYTTRWLFGSEYVISSQNDLIASLAYINSEKKMLVFDMEVINQSKKDILVSPELFYYDIIVSKLEEVPAQVKAIDPEKKLLQLDKALSNENASLSNQAISNFLVETTDLIGDITESDDRTIQEEQLDSQEDLERKIDSDREEYKTRSKITDLNQQHNYWSTQVLRKTTLKPGEAIHGKIFFPAGKNTEKIQLIITLDNSQFEYIFDQQKY